MDKKERKELRNQLAEKVLSEFKRGLPVDQNVFPELFDYLDLQLEKKDCNHTIILTSRFLAKKGILNQNQVIDWLAKHGGYCDCEVLANVENLFDYLNKPIVKPVAQTQVKKQKLNSLKTDLGFNIEQVPAPWVFMETIVRNKSNYTFHIGKGTDCIVSLETLFPTQQLNNDKYWLDLWIKQTELNYNLDGLAVERPELENYSCVLVKSKNWTPVFYWFKNNLTDKWFLKMKTGLGRHKGDFKEFSKLVNNIKIEQNNYR